MKALFIGGTGNISTAVSRLAIALGIDLYHLNRGTTKINLQGVKTIIGDINHPKNIPDEIYKTNWDVVVNSIAFTDKDIERDIHLFKGKTKQYIFISSTSAYQKPLLHPVVTESTPLKNPYWEYSRNKIKCEDRLTQAYRNEDFPITIVRPSLTYDMVIPVAIGGFREYTTADRILRGKKIIVQGDGKSLWTVTHSKDFAKGFVGLMGNYQSIGHAFHITSDEILSWDSINIIVANTLGKEPKIVHIPTDFICKCDDYFTGTLLGDKSESVIFDNSKIKSFVPDFKATIPFKEGIRSTLDWFDTNPDKKIINSEKNKTIDRIIKAFEETNQ